MSKLILLLADEHWWYSECMEQHYAMTVWNNTILYSFDFQGFILRVQKLCHQTFCVFMPLSKIKKHLVHDLGSTVVFFPSWLCSISLGKQVFCSYLVSGQSFPGLGMKSALSRSVQSLGWRKGKAGSFFQAWPS